METRHEDQTIKVRYSIRGLGIQRDSFISVSIENCVVIEAKESNTTTWTTDSEELMDKMRDCDPELENAYILGKWILLDDDNHSIEIENIYGHEQGKNN
jgi:hypothetical protein